MRSTPLKYALITGASQGLGKAYATELAKRGMNIILVSLPGEGLEAVATEIASCYPVLTAYYETDLSVQDNVLKLAEWVNERFNVFLLINNAGTGGSKQFIEASPKYINTIIQLNIMATSLLTRQLLPNLLSQQKGYVLNVSSLAAFSPVGFKTVYPASKSFVHSFSRGLNEELSGTSVFVSVVHPGPMRTNDEISIRIEKQGLLAKLALIDPYTMASKSINKLFQRHAVIVLNPVSLMILRMIPQKLRLSLMTNKIKRELLCS